MQETDIKGRGMAFALDDKNHNPSLSLSIEAEANVPSIDIPKSNSKINNRVNDNNYKMVNEKMVNDKMINPAMANLLISGGNFEKLLDSSNTGPIHCNGRFFTLQKDGRTVMLRGVNLSGNTKLPFTPRLATHKEGLYEQVNDVSFVGRPFPLIEADEHFARLRSWYRVFSFHSCRGFNFLRFNTTWEAIEHSGPFTGGSGAPYWTLEKAGFEPKNFTSTHAALVQNTYPDPSKYPKMIWPTNYFKLATSTMFTLFFAGKVYAPQCMVEGVNIQDYLQSHYFNAVAKLAEAIVATPGLVNDVVVGFDTLNEPSMGLIGIHDIREIAREQELRKGTTPTPFQAMIMGMGMVAEKVEHWEMTAIGPQKMSESNIDPKGVRAWKNTCIWAQHGVWSLDSKAVLKPHYFSTRPDTGEKVNGLQDFWKPFVNRFAKRIREVHRDAIIFVEPPVNAVPPAWDENDCSDRLVFAPHWYDGLTLINKNWNSWFNVDYIGFLRGKYSSIAFSVKLGEASIRKAFQGQLKILREEGEKFIGLYPTVFGEIGIPYDMDGKAAYSTGDYTAQIQAMDANMSALEGDLLSFTLWNYTADNCHQWGDQWNGEDLSLWSKPSAKNTEKSNSNNDPCQNLNEGARALEAFVRPYPISFPGTPISVAFDLQTGYFAFTFSHALREDGLWDPMASGFHRTHVEIFLPSLHFSSKDEISCWVSSGSIVLLPQHQRAIWTCGCKVHHPDLVGLDSYGSSAASNTSREPLRNPSNKRSKIGDLIVSHRVVIKQKDGEDMVETENVKPDGIDEGACPAACNVM